MTQPDLELETTIVVGDNHDEGDEPSTHIMASIIGTDERHHTASAHLDGVATDDQIADALVRVALAAAQMHSSGAWFALQRHLAVQEGR